MLSNSSNEVCAVCVCVCAFCACMFRAMSQRLAFRMHSWSFSPYVEMICWSWGREREQFIKTFFSILRFAKLNMLCELGRSCRWKMLALLLRLRRCGEICMAPGPTRAVGQTRLRAQLKRKNETKRLDLMVLELDG